MFDKSISNVQVTKFIPVEREKVFLYFTRPELVEKWSAPDGMTLKVPKFEARIGGQYRYEHTSADGLYLCDGHFKEYVPNEKLVFVDTVKDPNVKTIFTNLVCEVIFKKVAGGTEISINQKGFPDEESMKSCEESWNQCFDNLSNLLGGGMGTRPETQTKVKDIYDSNKR